MHDLRFLDLRLSRVDVQLDFESVVFMGQLESWPCEQLFVFHLWTPAT
jgi:hypothetical protein